MNCCNTYLPIDIGCNHPVTLPGNMEGFSIEEITAKGIVVGYEVTIQYRRCYPIVKRYVNIETFFEEYNIKIKGYGTVT